MFKNINKIFAATALVALVLTSCTDEADVLDNTPIKNKKTLTQPTIERPHPEYEETDMSSEDVIQLVSDFNNAMRGESEATTMDITNALLAMETFFNYGVVAKQEIVDTTTYYTGSNFQFEVSTDDQGNINIDELVEAYTLFLNEFLGIMNGKYLQLSDLFVKEIDNNIVTFALEIPSFTEYDRIAWEPHKCKVLNSPDGPFDIPSGATIDLTSMFNNFGSPLDQERLSELCSTYEIGFIYNIETKPYTISLYSDPFHNSAAPDPYIVDRDMMIYELLPAAIVKSWGLTPSNNQNINIENKIVDLFIKAYCNYVPTNTLQVKFFVTKKRVGIYDISPDWLLLDDIRFVGI